MSRPVLVTWVDSARSMEWTPYAPCLKPTVCKSVGWVVAETEEVLVLAPHITIEDEPQRCGDMTIPKCAIKKTQTLTYEGLRCSCSA